VIATVTRFHTLMGVMSAGGPIDMAGLRSVATAAFAQTTGKNLAGTKAAGYVVRNSRGGPVYTPRTVSVAGGSARYTECTDARGTLLVQHGTTLPPDPDPTAYAPTVSTLSLIRDGVTWRIASVQSAGAPC